MFLQNVLKFWFVTVIFKIVKAILQNPISQKFQKDLDAECLPKHRVKYTRIHEKL